jgi:hypothetical protein
MTEHKLLKYLSKTVELPEGDKHLTPVVFTDSKGTCLERYSQNILANSIQIIVNFPKVECSVAAIAFEKDYFVDEYISDI